MAYSIHLLYTSVPVLIALKKSVFLSHAQPSTTIIIPRMEIRQENSSISSFGNFVEISGISGNFVEIVGA